MTFFKIIIIIGIIIPTVVQPKRWVFFVCFCFLLKLFPQLVSDTLKQTHLSIEY